MKNLGIHVRILLTTFLLIGATTFALGYIGATIAYQFSQKRFVNHISFLTKYLALMSELGILIDDRAMLKNLAVNLLSEQDVVAVVILDSNNRELIKVPEKTTGDYPVMEMPVVMKELPEESKAFATHGGSKEGLIGKVRIVYSTKGIGQLWSTVITTFIWLAAGLTCLAVLVFYFISRSLVAPVKGLAQAARRVAAGDRKLRTVPGSLPETRELAVAFNFMLDSLEENRKSLEKTNEQMRRQKTLAEMGKFSLMIAHELKNPLGIIKSSLDILKKDYALSSDNTMVFYIEDEIRKLNRLIGDFLMFARPVQPSFDRTELNALLREIMMRFELQKTGTRCEIRSQIPSGSCYAQVDSDLVIRAIDNVVKNAVEANGNQGVVEVAATRRGMTWTVEIADNGEGISPENMDKIFNPFFTTRADGVGLGLAYASQAIGSHGGRISAENRSGGGALFKLEIPVSPEET